MSIPPQAPHLGPLAPPAEMPDIFELDQENQAVHQAAHEIIINIHAQPVQGPFLNAPGPLFQFLAQNGNGHGAAAHHFHHFAGPTNHARQR